MSGELRDFHADKVTINWGLGSGAVRLHTGLIAGTGAMTDALTRDRSTMKVDRQGNGALSRTKIRAGTLNLTYMADSPTNGILTGIIQNEDTLGIVAAGPIVIKNNGVEVITYLGASIQSEPGLGFGDDAADRVYVWSFVKRVLLATGLPAV